MTVHIVVAALASVVLHGAALAWASGLAHALRPSVQGAAEQHRPLRVSIVETRPAPARVIASAPSKAAPAASAERNRALPAAVYYRLSELDERPQVRVHVEPQFPALAPVSEGRVRVHLYIGDDGSVEKLEVSDAEPPGVFESSAAQAFSAARFTPGRKNGVAVRSRMSIEVLFGTPAPLTQEAAAFAAPR